MLNSLDNQMVLGFTWNSLIIPHDIPTYPSETVCIGYLTNFNNHIQSAARFSGNPISDHDQINTLISGITIGGFKISEQQQVLNLIKASNIMVSLVRNKQFFLDKPTFELLNQKVAYKETNFAGIFIDYFNDPILKQQLNNSFNESLDIFKKISNPIEKAFIVFLFFSINNFFKMENLNTAFLIMNAVLLSHGLKPILIPINDANEFSNLVNSFKDNKTGDALISFLYQFYPDKNMVDLNQKNKLTQRLDFNDDEYA